MSVKSEIGNQVWGAGRTFPTETWTMIAEGLDSKDLCQLCCTSTYFLPIVRPLIYRHVALTSGFGYKTFAKTISLLISNAAVASCVKTLYVNAYTRSISRVRAISQCYGPATLCDSCPNFLHSVTAPLYF